MVDNIDITKLKTTKNKIMIQDFNPRARETERNFEPIEWNQNGNHQEEINPPHGPDHPACSTPNPPWWCGEQAPGVNVDAYVPILLLIALVIGLMKLQKFKKIKANEYRQN